MFHGVILFCFSLSIAVAWSQTQDAKSCIWEDMKRLRREGLTGLVTVQFIGEPAIGERGPWKEFFYLIHKHMQQVSSLFEGPPRCWRFTHCYGLVEGRVQHLWHYFCPFIASRISCSYNIWAPYSRLYCKW